LILHKNFVIIIIENKEKVIIIMVFNLLTDYDKKLIDSYRNEYAGLYNKSSCDRCTVDELLGPWNEAKNQYLKNLFTNGLIVTKPIEFKEDISEITDKMEDILRDERIDNFISEIKDIYRSRAHNARWEDSEEKESCFVSSLLSAWTLANNAVKDNYFFGYKDKKTPYEFHLKDTTLKVQYGMKPMRIIAKIANSFGIGITPDKDGVSDFEYFRRKHSLALNQKVLKGDLCLSIHPLDYMTMSDNDEGWDSCMSWMEDGEYKQGTVEMMNSPCVIVGYLASDSNSLKWYDNEWNSKKWRSLFIVDKNFIINVRSYPYDNDNLIKSAIAEIAKLSGWGEVPVEKFKYLEDYENHRRKRKPVEIQGRKVAIDFHTQAMYNDFGTNHYIAVNPNNTDNIIDFEYCYSGLPECMYCGTTDDSLVGMSNGEGSLHCFDCCPNVYCEDCDERLSPDNLYITKDGSKLCEYCYQNCTITCSIDGKVYSENVGRTIYLSNSNEEPNFDYAECIYVYRGNVGSNEWLECFNVDTYRVYEGDWVDRYYIYPSDCTEKGLELFGLNSEEALKDYMRQNEDI
jgi:hypothetical protein